MALPTRAERDTGGALGAACGLDDLARALRCLPGVGPKAAQRMALHLLQYDREGAVRLAHALEHAARAVRHCEPHYSNEFSIDNARIYVNGKVHKYLGFEFNTECFNCSRGQGSGPCTGAAGQNFGGNSSIGLLDAIGKFEFNEMANLWVGRMLLPSERGSLNNVFYNAIYSATPTPGFPAADSQNFNGVNGLGGGAGLYGRDNAATFLGKIHPFGTHLLYVLSVSQGLRGGPNAGNSLMYTGRLQWNLLNHEKNPGYYTMGTYYGTMGDIVAIGVSGQHQKDGAGSANGGTSDFTAVTVDLLVEKLLPNNMGVFTFNGEFKRFFANYGAPTTKLEHGLSPGL